MKRQQAAAVAIAAANNNKLNTNTNTSNNTNHASITSTSTTNTAAEQQRTTLYPLPPPINNNKRRWNLDLAPSSSSSSSLPSLSSSLVSSKDLSFPSGWLSTGEFANERDAHAKKESSSKTADLVYQSALSTGMAPGRQLLMTAFVLWMSGNSLQIFSIVMLGMAFWQPIQKLMALNTEFARYSTSQVNLFIPKLVFMACNLAGIALALYKSNNMGLLPSSAADWLTTAVRPVRTQATDRHYPYTTQTQTHRRGIIPTLSLVVSLLADRTILWRRLFLA